ncbi:MAG: PQQ-binding-like beta-propeller repeat protein [Verrucomicrobia bacterium]|nr:PQQ-binding-like beta-propeller repeat protein [Verrucomicrobiota bacterium]
MKLISRIQTIALACLCTVCLWQAPKNQAASSWNRFRGPNGNGIAETSVKLSQLTLKDTVWKIDLPGEGHSSPVLWDDTIFLTSMSKDTGVFHILAINAANGNILWTRDIDYETFKKHDFNSFASPSVTLDADRVYVLWATPDHFYAAALDHAGEWLWKEDLGPFKSQHGVGVSPILYKNKLIVANDQIGASFMTALDIASGSRVWTQNRKSGKAAYSTPCIYTDSTGHDQLICNSEAEGISALNPDTGSVLWTYGKAFDKRSCSSPIVAGGKIFGSCGSGGGGNFVVAIEPPSGTTSSEPKLAYELRRQANYVPTPIAVGDLAFFWSDTGFVSCVDPASGQVHYQNRVRSRYFGSPVAVGNEVACLSTTGELVVIPADKEFKILNRIELEATTHTTPAFDSEAMYVRTISQLYKFKN